MRAISLKIVTAALGLALLAALPAVAAEFSADMQLDMMGQMTKGKLYVKGPRQRVELEGPGGLMVNILDAEKEKTWLIFPARKAYMENSLGQASQNQPYITGIKDLPKGSKKIGSEKVSGYDCDIYQIKTPAGTEAKVWIAEELDFPIKSQGQTPRGGMVTSVLKNIKKGGVKDSIFKVPAGFKPMASPAEMMGGQR